MVDLRPLLFINGLMLMLFLTAGFVNVNAPETPIGSTIPAPLVADKTADAGLDNTGKASANVMEAVEESTSALTEKDHSDEAEVSHARIALPTAEEVEQAIFADEAIFADNVPLPHKDEKTRAEIHELASQTHAEEPMVISYSNEPKEAPATTGTLVVRSNVHDDTVLINGKPYGPTKLELELTPGSYIVEVAKSGYNSWTTKVDMRRGKTQSLMARLEHYTSVEYINGTWVNDIKTGEGRYLEEGVLEYNGSFVNGKFHGTGSVRYTNGTKYQGEWFEGKMKGHGSFTSPEGDTYIGEMDDNKFNGEGTLTKATGDIYTGFWIGGVLNGQGSLTTKDGLLYVGGFSDNLFHGSGSLTYPNGGHYEGSFSNGMFHGKGVEIYPNGKKYVGQFIDGLYHGKGEILNPNGSKITGTFKDGEPFGKATLTTAEGEVFTARSSEPGVCYRLKSYRATECPTLEGW